MAASPRGATDRVGPVHGIRHPPDPQTAMPPSGPVKGPASYVPSIERTYGEPVEHWFRVLDTVRDRKHMEQVAVLTAEHGRGPGPANALVARHRAQSAA